MEIEILENKGTKKRYKIRLKEAAKGFFDWFFGSNKKSYDVTILAKREIEVEELNDMATTLLANQGEWKQTKDKSKGCEYIAKLDEYEKITFFIKTTCDATSETTE